MIRRYSEIKFNILLLILLLINMDNFANHTIRIAGKNETQFGLRASGCIRGQLPNGNQDENTVTCYLFDDDKCHIKTFSKFGQAKAPNSNWTTDLNCGFSKPDNVKIIVDKITASGNIFSGDNPMSLASFDFDPSLNMKLYCRGGNSFRKTILVNKNKSFSKPVSLADSYSCITNLWGDISTKPGAAGCTLEDNKKYVTCTIIEQTSCLKRRYAVNGARVDQGVSSNDCGYNNTAISAQIYNSFNVLQAGLNPLSSPEFTYQIIAPLHPLQKINLNIKFSDTDIRNIIIGQMTVGCKTHPDDPENKYRCYALNAYDCKFIDIAKNGTIIGVETLVPNCGYNKFIQATQQLYDSLNIYRKGRAPDTSAVIDADNNFNDSNSFYGVSFYPKGLFSGIVARQIDSTGITVGQNVGNAPVKVAGCSLDSDPNYLKCSLIYDTMCRTAQLSKNGFVTLDNGWKDIPYCGYTSFPVKVVNMMDNFDKLLFGVKPIIPPKAVFSFKTEGDYQRLYVNGKLINDTDNFTTSYPINSAKAIACKYLPDQQSFEFVECTFFNHAECFKRTFSAFGTIIERLDRQQTCGYKNYDVASNIYNNSELKAGPPPSLDPAKFSHTTVPGGFGMIQQLLYVNNSNYNNFPINSFITNELQTNPDSIMGCRILDINQSDQLVADVGKACQEIKPDGSIIQHQSCVQCIAIDRLSCSEQYFNRQGNNLTMSLGYKISNSKCGYVYYTDAKKIADVFEPYRQDSLMFMTGKSPSLAAFTAEQENGLYVIKANGKKLIEGSKYAGCTPITYDAEGDPYRTCAVLDQDKCYQADFWASGDAYPKEVIKNWLTNCGLQHNSTAKSIIAGFESNVALGVDILQPAVFLGVYDSNYVDATNPYKKYYLKIGGLNDTSYVATRAIGCTAIQTDTNGDHRKCYAFDQFRCYIRSYDIFGLPRNNWVDNGDCGYAYKDVAIPLYENLEIVAGDHPNVAPIGIQGVLVKIQGENKYQLSIFGSAIPGGIFNNGVGCKAPGVDIPLSDPEKNKKLECIAFNQGQTLNRVFYLTGLAATNWTPIQDVSCDLQGATPVDCIFGSKVSKLEYCKLNPSTVAIKELPPGLDAQTPCINGAPNPPL